MTTTLDDQGTAVPPPPGWDAPSRRRRVPFRKAWILAGSIFVLASVGWGTFQIVNALAYDKKQFRESFGVTTTSAVRSLDIDNAAGSVKVIASDRNDIVIDGEVLRSLAKPTHHERVNGDVLEIGATCNSLGGFCSVDYDIQVPRDVDVRVRASGGGVRVSNVTGDLDLRSSGGGVRVEGATGTLFLRSSGGGITAIGLQSTVVDASSSGGGVGLEFLEEPVNVSATSSGGGVTVVIPNTRATYNIKASSSAGSVSRDVRSDPESSRRIHVSSSGGGVTLRYPESP
jgi:putative adhesin